MAPIDPFKPVVVQHPSLPLELHVIPLGANPVNFIVTDRSTGAKNDMLIGFENPKDHWQVARSFIGPIIGRYANRLPAGQQTYNGGEVNVPEFSGHGVSLHGGPEVTKTLPSAEDGKLEPQSGPLDRLVYSRLSSSQSQLFGQETDNDATLILGAISSGVAQGEPGYPGTIRVEALFALQEGKPKTLAERGALPGESAGMLRMEYRAALVDDGTGIDATPLNMTHHWAFNLSASDASTREKENCTINDHLLRIRASPGVEPPAGADGRIDGQQLWTPELDDKMVPTGQLIVCTVSGPNDFLNPGNNSLGRPLKSMISPKDMYDNQYIWGLPDPEKKNIDSSTIPPGPRLLLTAPSTGVSVAFETNQAAVQIYTTTGLPDAPAPANASSGGAKKIIHGGDGKTIGNHKCSGVCLEFGAPHGTFLHKQYQELARNDTILRKGQTYHHVVEAEVFIQK